MQWVRGNRAIRDHAQYGKILLVFETVKDGRRRFVGPMSYFKHYTKTLPDKNGNPRKGIIFKLAETDTPALIDTPSPETVAGLGFLSSRTSAIDAAKDVAEKVKTAQERRKRSQTISKYVQERALGFCEICGYAAPFERTNGKPYLESHHITQLSDDGPDAPSDVVAACPTCHRKVHHGAGGDELNAAAHERIQCVEEAIENKRLIVVTAAIIEDGKGRILIAKRKHTQQLGAKWEFPGGKIEKGETLPACLSREISEELGIQISTPRPFFMVDHRYPTFDIRLCALKTSIVGGELHPRDHEEVLWVQPSLLSTMELAPADVEIAKSITAIMAHRFSHSTVILG
jgi:5-methylcytosine-specific restriction protein A